MSCSSVTISSEQMGQVRVSPPDTLGAPPSRRLPKSELSETELAEGEMRPAEVAEVMAGERLRRPAALPRILPPGVGRGFMAVWCVVCGGGEGGGR